MDFSPLNPYLQAPVPRVGPCEVCGQPAHLTFKCRITGLMFCRACLFAMRSADRMLRAAGSCGLRHPHSNEFDP